MRNQMVTNSAMRNFGYKIGVDIGGTKVLIIIADESNHFVFKEKIKTSSDIYQIIMIIDECIQNAALPEEKIMGMGIGIPGWVNSREGIVIDAPALKWKDLNLREIFKKKYSFPIYLANDVNLAVIGEWWFGGFHSRNIFYIAIGTGVGSAILVNGEVIEGHNFSAGEIGYFIDKEDIWNEKSNNPLNFGTFECKTSGTALSKEGWKYGYSSRELFLQYRLNNPAVIPIIQKFVLELSVAIANVVSLLNPEFVIIGGGVAESMSCVIDEIRHNVAKFTPVRTQLELSKLGGEAGALGGLAIVLQKQTK